MSRLERLVKKYGDRKIDKSGWFHLDPEYQEPVIRIPAGLKEYIDLVEGQVIEVREVPEELSGELESLREALRRAAEVSDLTEYRIEGIQQRKQPE